MPMVVNLYTTLGCHLCDKALDMLKQLRANGREMEICEVEISESESLVQSYGLRIPVVALAGSNRELGWPFSVDELETWLSAEEE